MFGSGMMGRSSTEAREPDIIIEAAKCPARTACYL